MPLAVILITGILFLLLLVTLGFQPKLLGRVTGYLFLFVGISAAAFYGYGYAVICESFPQAVIRALSATFCTFLGRNEIGAVSAAPALKAPGMQFFMYFVHLVGLYVTASAVISAMGTGLLRRLNLLLIRRGDLNLVYGANEESITFAQQLPQDSGVTVFTDPGAGSGFDSRILRMGSILFTDGPANKPSAEFLRRIGMGPGRRRLNIYCMDADAGGNLRYAETLLKALDKAGVSASQTRLTVLVEDASVGAGLQAAGRPGEEGAHYGYGSVLALDRAELAARVMIRTWPPYSVMDFDGRGHAEEDFEAVVIGFGQTGQAVLRSLVMNGQFDGSRFHAIVIAKNCGTQTGSFFYSYPDLCSHYDIEFREDDARSKAVFDYLNEKRRELNYVVIATGDKKENAEIAGEYTDYLKAAGSRALVIQCSKTGVSRLDPVTGLTDTVPLCSPELLCSSRIDAMAMLLNHRYHLKEGRTAQEDWEDCDYFSRMSCRASADFLDAFLRSTGCGREDVRRGGWPADAEVLETLSRTEHLRWNAFHFCMGYRTMPEEVFRERARAYRAQPETEGGSRIRLTKDAQQKYHACLIPWEELDALAEQEAAVTGKFNDYKEMDRDNIRMIPEMLKTEMPSDEESK